MDEAGVTDLASPWSLAPLLPLAVICAAERLGKLQWFSGMSLPSLFVMAAATALIWTLNARPPVPSICAYAALAGLAAAWGFLMFRMWTFDPVER